MSVKLFLSHYYNQDCYNDGPMTLDELKKVCIQLNIAVGSSDSEKQICKSIKLRLSDEILFLKLSDIWNFLFYNPDTSISELEKKIDELNLNEKDSIMLKSAYKKIVDVFSSTGKFIASNVSTMKIINHIISRQILTKELSDESLPIYDSEYFREYVSELKLLSLFSDLKHILNFLFSNRNTISFNDLEKKIVLLSGPRQTGKTTLSHDLFPKNRYQYLNFDTTEDRQIILSKAWDRKKDLIVFDSRATLAPWSVLNYTC